MLSHASKKETMILLSQHEIDLKLTCFCLASICWGASAVANRWQIIIGASDTKVTHVLIIIGGDTEVDVNQWYTGDSGCNSDQIKWPACLAHLHTGWYTAITLIITLEKYAATSHLKAVHQHSQQLVHDHSLEEHRHHLNWFDCPGSSRLLTKERVGGLKGSWSERSPLPGGTFSARIYETIYEIEKSKRVTTNMCWS